MTASEEILPVVSKVAVILIVRNQAQELRRALEALGRSQPREGIEILVVDCASTDGTPAVADEFPSVSVQRLPQDFGATKALNIATRTARTEFLFLLSPEVEVAADTIAQLLKKLEANADTAAVCPLLVDENGNPIARTRRFPDRQALAAVQHGGEIPWIEIPAEMLSADEGVVLYPGREALLVRKSFITGMNYFDERFGEYFADADLATQIRRANRRIRLYPSILATWHRSTGSAPDDVLRKSDRILGAATLLGKHQGFMAGFGYRWGAIFSALIHFDFSLVSALVGGRKLGGEASRSYPT